MRCRQWLVLVAVLVAASVLPNLAAAQDAEKPPTPEQLELFRTGMRIEAEKAEMAHQQALRKLELEERSVGIERLRRRVHGRHNSRGGGPLLLVILALHVLLTVWVCKDMRERNIGRKLWVPIVLIGGLFAAILYAIVRLDTKPTE